MEKTYQPQAIEDRWYRTWEEQNYFAPKGSGPGYCIMLPPPNVTGSLHMGHAFQHTLMDILIRYHRMLGDRTLWQCGTDHAGIATQMVVERQLEQQGISRHDLGRDKFVDKVWEWKHESGNTISRQLRRLGTSMDWSRERFTMDEGLSRAVRKVFIDLYHEGLIYRGKRLVNWDPVLHTAISDLEVISEEENGHMWHIRYPVHGENSHVVVATTRPETMLGDAAIAVHPDDDRYRHLVGKSIDLPLTGREIPVIEDDYVDPEFGSGCVKITPAHDFNDYAVGQRHDLPQINIFTVDAALNENAPEKYRGMDRYAARKQIVKDLDAVGLLEKTEPHKLVVPRGDRSGVVVEPYLTDQWYVKTASLAAPAIKAVEDGRIRFIPDNWSKTYFEWMRNIEDWCISRQLWWGHQIPAWYDDEGNIYVGESEEAIRKQENLGNAVKLIQDEDVLDTWFSSALWPFSTLDWPEDTDELETFYPTSVLVTGFDIIFFWVARMIMMGLKFMHDVPFREVYITGLIRDEHGQKMSKSRGNILDPIDLIDGISLDALVKKRITGLMRPGDADKIEKATRREFPDGIEAYGTDALRFTFSSLASPARNINFDIGRIGGYRNFCNKLWNATRYVLMSFDSANIELNGDIQLNLAERWIKSRLHLAVDEVTEGITTYRFDLASQALHEFTWDEYCDWYLELSKTTLTDPDVPDPEKRGTMLTLLDVLETLLRLMHPFMPFITEELWQRVSPLLDRHNDSIMLQAYPEYDASIVEETAVNEIEWIKTFLLGIRRIRAERDIAPGKPLSVQVRGGNEQEQAWLSRNSHYIKTLGRIDSITPVDREPDDAVISLAGDMSLLVPLADLIDPEMELKRLQKELDRLDNDQQRIRKKLNNRDFVSRAPENVVNKEKQRLEEATAAHAALMKQYERIKSLLQ